MEKPAQAQPFQKLDFQNAHQIPMQQEAAGPPARSAYEGSEAPKHRRSLRLPIGIGVAVLLLAGGAFGFYEWHKQSADAADLPTAAETQSTPEAPVVAQGPASIEKPADTTSVPIPTPAPAVVAAAAPPPAAPAPASAKARPAARMEEPPREVVPASVRPSTPAPIVRDSPLSSKAGVLHYSGPPVHFGEVITFSGLPGAMLRFSFDHSAWQPRILHQPDGTQTLTLRSLTQQDQTQCEVRWEVAQ